MINDDKIIKNIERLTAKKDRQTTKKRKKNSIFIHKKNDNDSQTNKF